MRIADFKNNYINTALKDITSFVMNDAVTLKL